MNTNSQALAFKALHSPGNPVLLTNVWDIPSAGVVSKLPGTKAMATASYAVALANGTEDDDLTLEQNLNTVAGIAPVAHRAGKPLTVDLQDAYGDRLEDAVAKLIEFGVVGINLEDVDKASHTQYPISVAAERVKRALDTAKAKGVPDFVVNARCDTLVIGGKMEDVIERGKAYLAAGATTVFVWGGSKRGGISKDEVQHMVTEFKGRLNVSFKSGGLSIPELAKIGVARISLGPGLLLSVLEHMKKEVELLIAQSA